MNTTDAQILLAGAANEQSKRVIVSLALGEDYIDSTFALVAAVYRQALRDAQRGDVKAAVWLDITAPDWREKVPQQGRGRRGA